MHLEYLIFDFCYWFCFNRTVCVSVRERHFRQETVYIQLKYHMFSTIPAFMTKLGIIRYQQVVFQSAIAYFMSMIMTDALKIYFWFIIQKQFEYSNFMPFTKKRFCNFIATTRICNKLLLQCYITFRSRENAKFQNI